MFIFIHDLGGREVRICLLPFVKLTFIQCPDHDPTYNLGFEDIQESGKMVVLAGDFAKVDHLEVGAHARALALARVHAPPFVLDLHKHWHLAGETKEVSPVSRSTGRSLKPEAGCHRSNLTMNRMCKRIMSSRSGQGHCSSWRKL